MRVMVVVGASAFNQAFSTECSEAHKKIVITMAIWVIVNSMYPNNLGSIFDAIFGALEPELVDAYGDEVNSIGQLDDDGLRKVICSLASAIYVEVKSALLPILGMFESCRFNVISLGKDGLYLNVEGDRI